MKVFIVRYIMSSYEDTIQAVFLSMRGAYKFIDDNFPEHDKQNCYVEEWDVNE